MIDGESLTYGTGKEERIKSITRGLFEESDSDSITFDEYFLVHTDSEMSMLLRYRVHFVEVGSSSSTRWVRSAQWLTVLVGDEDVDEWKTWLDEHGNTAQSRPDDHPPRMRFINTRGPDRDISPEHHGLVEVPVKSGRRIWIKNG